MHLPSSGGGSSSGKGVSRNLFGAPTLALPPSLSRAASVGSLGLSSSGAKPQVPLSSVLGGPSYPRRGQDATWSVDRARGSSLGDTPTRAPTPSEAAFGFDQDEMLERAFWNQHPDLQQMSRFLLAQTNQVQLYDVRMTVYLYARFSLLGNLSLTSIYAHYFTSIHYPLQLRE
jgi:hypothetical protein